MYLNSTVKQIWSIKRKKKSLVFNWLFCWILFEVEYLTFCSNFILCCSRIFGVWWKVIADLNCQNHFSLLHFIVWQNLRRIIPLLVYLLSIFRLFIMLQRFPIESVSRQRKLQEVCTLFEAGSVSRSWIVILCSFVSNMFKPFSAFTFRQNVSFPLICS